LYDFEILAARMMKNDDEGMVEFTAFEDVILTVGFVTKPIVPTVGVTVNV
jgi:hypothetical protein